MSYKRYILDQPTTNSSAGSATGVTSAEPMLSPLGSSKHHYSPFPLDVAPKQPVAQRNVDVQASIRTISRRFPLSDRANPTRPRRPAAVQTTTAPGVPVLLLVSNYQHRLKTVQDNGFLGRTSHQSTRPRRRKKWLRQPVRRQTDGFSDTVPPACSVNRQRGRPSEWRLICSSSPHPQGQINAANQTCAPSPTTYTVHGSRTSGNSATKSVARACSERRMPVLRKSATAIRAARTITSTGLRHPARLTGGCPAPSARAC